ncbi:serine protease [Synechococcus sp. N32]|uniref:trypsin-like serine peptidase n=1 Tax=Synechococcus sp. N32 TaxID=2575514 RepID=UPI000E0EBF61|nr:trypsin-like serine protease [Synechococcus sp. N32]
MKINRFALLSSALLASGAFYLPVFAETGDVISPIVTAEASSSTSSDLRSLKTAKPMPRPKGNQKPQFDSSAAGAAGVSSRSFDGRSVIKSKGRDSRAWGSFGIPYTSTRVRAGYSKGITSSKKGYLTATYPYRAAGKLTFKNDGKTFSCSAQLIGPSILITAAHCVGPFGGKKFYTDFTYYPALYADSSETSTPYGTWKSLVEVLPRAWYNGTDSGSGACRNNDVAIIALQPESGKFLGKTTGWYGYSWGGYSFRKNSKTKRTTAAVTTVGYPGLLDNGLIMQRQDGPAYLAKCKGKGEQIYQGSNFTGGSSGGAWLVNFDTASVGVPSFSGGASKGSQSSMSVVGVTSWGASDPNRPKDNWSSRLGKNKEYPKSSYTNADSKMVGEGNIGSLLNSICAVKVKGKSLYELGYCK